MLLGSGRNGENGDGYVLYILRELGWDWAVISREEHSMHGVVGGAYLIAFGHLGCLLFAVAMAIETYLRRD